ncbi:MAG TPA: hypothetical protein DDZ51_04725 [Planctomycetaceae bacterium]|nr:hypothetical protein [Planctomycetaceae bacterium]
MGISLLTYAQTPLGEMRTFARRWVFGLDCNWIIHDWPSRFPVVHRTTKRQTSGVRLAQSNGSWSPLYPLKRERPNHRYSKNLVSIAIGRKIRQIGWQRFRQSRFTPSLNAISVPNCRKIFKSTIIAIRQRILRIYRILGKLQVRLPRRTWHKLFALQKL